MQKNIAGTYTVLVNRPAAEATRSKMMVVVKTTAVTVLWWQYELVVVKTTALTVPWSPPTR